MPYLSRSQGSVVIKVDKPSYNPGELIKGAVYLKINKPDIAAGMLVVKLIGLEKCNQLDEFQQFYSFKNYFYKKVKKLTNFGSVLPKMAVKKYFEIEVPDKFPSITINSYKSVQYRILYYLQIEFENKEEKRVIKARRHCKTVIHVNSRLPTKIPQPLKVQGESNLVKFCFFSMGTTKMHLLLPKQQFVVGEEIAVYLLIDNSNCKLKVEEIEISVQSQLQVTHQANKRTLSEYFGLCQTKLQQQIPGRGQKAINFTIKLEQDQPHYIYPQSSFCTRRASMLYNLSVTAILQKSFNSNCQNLCRVVVPIQVTQQEKRKISNAHIQPEFVQQFDQNTQSQIQMIGTDRLTNSQFYYGDHNADGYGPQDGYTGKLRVYNPDDSLNENQIKDVEGALDKLFLKNQKKTDKYKDEEEELVTYLDQNTINNENTTGTGTSRLKSFVKKLTIFSKLQTSSDRGSFIQSALKQELPKVEEAKDEAENRQQLTSERKEFQNQHQDDEQNNQNQSSQQDQSDQESQQSHQSQQSHHQVRKVAENNGFLQEQYNINGKIEQDNIVVDIGEGYHEKKASKINEPKQLSQQNLMNYYQQEEQLSQRPEIMYEDQV